MQNRRGDASVLTFLCALVLLVKIIISHLFSVTNAECACAPFLLLFIGFFCYLFTQMRHNEPTFYGFASHQRYRWLLLVKVTAKFWKTSAKENISCDPLKTLALTKRCSGAESMRTIMRIFQFRFFTITARDMKPAIAFPTNFIILSAEGTTRTCPDKNGFDYWTVSNPKPEFQSMNCSRQTLPPSSFVTDYLPGFRTSFLTLSCRLHCLVAHFLLTEISSFFFFFFPNKAQYLPRNNLKQA